MGVVRVALQSADKKVVISEGEVSCMIDYMMTS